MLAQLLTRLTPVHVAVTQEEREAVYRLRYRSYIEELNYASFPGVDHKRKWFRSPDDDDPNVTLFYTGSATDMTGTVRMCIFKPGEVPDKFASAYSLARFPGIESLAIGENSRMTIKSSARGTAIVLALVRATYEAYAAQGADLIFCACAPGLVRPYRKFGMRPYGGQLIDYGMGAVQIPLVMVTSDIAALKRAGSFLVPSAKKHFGQGKRPKLDTSAFASILDPGEAQIETSANAVFGEISSAFPDARNSPFSALSEKAMKRLARSGFLLRFGAGELVFHEGVREYEIYVVLDGTFEVMQGARRVATLTRGELFGEIAFFTQSARGERRASVRAVTSGRLFVLRRKFLHEFTRSDPDAGFQILMNMGRIMAQRLSNAGADSQGPEAAREPAP